MIPKPPSIPAAERPPAAPTLADASVVTAGQREQKRYASLLSGGNDGKLKRKAEVKKPSLIGGEA